MWCVMPICIFCIFTQAALEPAVREKWCYLGWHRKAFCGLGFQDVMGFDSDYWEKNEKKRKEKEKEVATGFFSRARAGHTLLLVQGRVFMAVRCNQRLI